MSGPVEAGAIDRVIACVADRFDVSPRAILSRSRTQRIADARHWSMWLARNLTPYSLPMIGRHLGPRDHTTVLHGVRRITALVACDDQAAQLAAELVVAVRFPRLQPERIVT